MLESIVAPAVTGSLTSAIGQVAENGAEARVAASDGLVDLQQDRELKTKKAPEQQDGKTARARS